MYKPECLSAAYLHRRLDYNPRTGEFVWFPRSGTTPGIRRWNAIHANKPAGHIGGGYRIIGVDRVQYLAHHIAWKMTYGESPPALIDHANRIKDDNRICNLREASFAENARNRGIIKTNSTSATGVYFNKDMGKWTASIYLDGRNRHLGTFEQFDDAVSARQTAIRKHYGAFAVNP